MKIKTGTLPMHPYYKDKITGGLFRAISFGLFTVFKAEGGSPQIIPTEVFMEDYEEWDESQYTAEHMRKVKEGRYEETSY